MAPPANYSFTASYTAIASYGVSVSDPATLMMPPGLMATQWHHGPSRCLDYNTSF
jgi:hypothetical protein